MGKVIVVGSSNTDMVFSSEKIPAPGETVLGKDFHIMPGGKGANQAVAAARAGAEVDFIAKVGNDDFGRRAIEGYRKDDIGVGAILTDNEKPSGTAMILVDTKNGQNSIVVAPGANGALTPEDIYQSEAIINSADVLLLQLETPLETVHAALKTAKANNVTTILNPAPAQFLSKEILELVDIITPNETETELLTQIQPNDLESARLAASKLMTDVNTAVVITMGENGAYYLSLKNGEGLVPAQKVEALDTTAAGDVFNGYLAAYIADGFNVLQAIPTANKAASICVTRMGAQPSIPFRKEL